MNTTYREGLARSIKEAVNPLLDSGRVRIVYRHRITNSTEVLAALALEAAGRQGSFCAMHDALVDTPEELDMDAILRAAGRLGLDTQALRKRVDRAADEVAVDDDTIDGVEVEGSEPVVFLQGERIPSAENAWHLTRRIDEAEATVEA
jgi:protein-disulfide isomerase